MPAGLDDQGALERGDGADHDAQAVAEHAAERQTLQLRAEERSVDAEQARHFGRIEAGAVVGDHPDPVDMVERDAGAVIERVIVLMFGPPPLVPAAVQGCSATRGDVSEAPQR